MTDPKAARSALIVLLRAQRSGMSRTQKLKRKKPSRWLYPWATEHRYTQSYRAWVKPVRAFVHEYMEKHQEAVLRGDSANAVVRQDVVAGESFAGMVRSLNGWVGAYISDDEEKKLRSPIYVGLRDIAESAFNFNGGQYDKSVKNAIGVNFPSDESWWPDARKQWQDNNYDVIRSDIRKYIADINSVTEQAVTNGWGVSVLSEKLTALDTKITKSRAAFIARDQIGKLNGTVTQKRMQDIGIKMYEWSSSSDERVRDSHALMDGLLCRWDDATVYSEDGGKTWIPRPAGAVLMHPGMDYQCRCCALAWFDELIDEADGVEIGTYTGGSFGGILDKNESEQDRFANEYYQEIINRKSKSDIAKIAKNTGFPLEKIADVRKHIFETTDHLFMDGRKAKFAPDARIALAWQRLEQGEALDTDILLLNHEYTEFAFMTKKGYTYEKAHWLSSLRYPWQFKIIEDLENLNDDEIHQIVRDRLKDYL
ncbi:MAG: minor capsid protein [Treponemataceae bacterium]|nr:minor capsid protein [Treponemataceae bacterium]